MSSFVVEFKYDKLDTVYYIVNEKIQEGIILSCIFQSSDENTESTFNIKERIFYMLSNKEVKYPVQVEEEDLFSTVDDLLKSLNNDFIKRTIT